MTSLHPDALTLYDAIRRGARLSNNGPMLGKRVKQADGSEPYEWIKYNDVIDRSIIVAHAMRHIGIPAGQETFIGVYAKNRPEWIIVEHATYTFNNVLVALYETLGAEACTFSLNQTEIQIVFCDSLAKAKSKFLLFFVGFYSYVYSRRSHGRKEALSFVEAFGNHG